MELQQQLLTAYACSRAPAAPLRKLCAPVAPLPKLCCTCGSTTHAVCTCGSSFSMVHLA